MILFADEASFAQWRSLSSHLTQYECTTRIHERTLLHPWHRLKFTQRIKGNLHRPCV